MESRGERSRETGHLVHDDGVAGTNMARVLTTPVVIAAPISFLCVMFWFSHKLLEHLEILAQMMPLY